MNLLSVNVARSIWLFPLNDLNPRGKSLYPALFSFLVQKYSFLKYPTAVDQFDEQKGIKFELGNFYNRANTTVIVNASIFSDGVVAETRSTTDDADAFLAEAMDAVCQEYGLTPMANIRMRKIYLSEIFVQTQQSLNLLNDKLDHFGHRLSADISGFPEQTWEASGISFSVDQGVQQAKPIPFRLERAANTAFSDNRYYSVAPLQTEKHLRLLDDLELILRGDPYTS